MDKDRLIALLNKLPPGTEVWVRGGAAASDDAWTPTLRVWNVGERLVATVEMAPVHDHHNYPEHYSGVQEVTQEILGEPFPR